jgi:hypothetical protein
VPPSRPVNAAVNTKDPLETFMFLYTPSFVGYSRIPRNFRTPAAGIRRTQGGFIRVYDSPLRCGFKARQVGQRRALRRPPRPASLLALP